MEEYSKKFNRGGIVGFLQVMEVNYAMKALGETLEELNSDLGRNLDMVYRATADDTKLREEIIEDLSTKRSIRYLIKEREITI